MADSATNEVSWQSAFWALVPIALNSMTQSSGEIFGFVRDHSFFLRSSPIVCAYNAFSILLLFGLHLVKRKSFSKASEAVISYRFRHADEGIGSGGLTDLQNHSRLRLFLFFAGALPQLIKIYALVGVPWTKLWATLFLLPFGLLEILGVSQCKSLFPSQREPPDDSGDEQNETYEAFIFLSFPAICAGGTFWFILVSGITIPGLVDEVANPTLISVFIFIAHLMSMCFVVGSMVWRTEERLRDAILASLAAFLQLNLISFFHLAPGEQFKSPIFLCTAFSPYFIAIVAEIVIYAKTRLPFGRLNMIRWSSALSKMYILLLHLSVGLAGYALYYDPKGTIKPKWTEYLG